MPVEEFCGICGYDAPFEPVCEGGSLRENRCPGCGAARRNSDLMRVALAEAGTVARLRWMHIYELQSRGMIHERLKNLPHYQCSEYLPGVPPGLADEHGVRSEDATRLTFGDHSFDLVISQDVFEHIEDVWQAFNEISRVLRPGGKHIFTVPIHEGKVTRSRKGMPPVKHGDPLNPDGSLVFWEFGDDLPARLKEMGINCHLALYQRFYSKEELCRVDSPEDYQNYLDFMRRKEKARFFRYNSAVFVAEKRLHPF